MTDTHEAVRLADWLQAAVQTYPQVSADEPGGYCSEMDQMIDQAAALLRRIPELEAEVQEQARLNGIGAERELALMAQVSRLEAERDQLRAELEKVPTQLGYASMMGCEIFAGIFDDAIRPINNADVLDAVAPVGDWSYSHDEERFSGQFSTREEAIDEAVSCGARFIGRVRHARDFISDEMIGGDIQERISEILGDEVGEVAECFSMTSDQERELGKVVLDWIEAGPGFNCWGIKDVEPIDAAIAAIGRQE